MGNLYKDIFDIAKAEKVLDKAHFGLEDIKKEFWSIWLF
jgi:ATP-dependent Lon protease